MRALITHHLLVAARTPALAIAACVYGALLAGFVLIWPNGVPGLSAQSVYEQLRVLQWCVLSVLLPWTALRCLASGRSEFILLSLSAGVSPARAVVSSAAATWAVLVCVLLSGLPAIFLAQQLSATPMWVVFVGALPPVALAAIAAIAARLWALYSDSSLTAWMAAGVSTIVPALLTAWLPAGAALGVAAIAALLAIGAIARTNTTMVYIQERSA